MLKNLLHILLETHIKHSVSLIENNSSETADLEISAIQVVEQPSGGSDNNIDPASQGVRLRLDRRSSVNCHRSVLV